MLETFLRYRYLLANLIGRDLKVKYRRSVLGILWSLLQPILLMLVLNAVFSYVFRNKVEHFPLYLITGHSLFGFFTEATNGALMSVVDSSMLIKKVYVPKYIFPLEKVLFAFVNMLFSMVAIVLLILMYGVPLSPTMLLFPVPLVALLMFAAGLGLMLANLYVFFRDIKYLYSVLTTAWMYLTPIFYDIEMLKGSAVYPIVRYNPLTCYITYFRDVFIYGNAPTLEQNLLCFGYGLAAIVLGTWIFKRTQDRFILHI